MTAKDTDLFRNRLITHDKTKKKGMKKNFRI